MFGYVRPFTPELLVRENEFYRAVYCGLCRSMRACTGLCSTFSLNYDFVFLALIRIVQQKERCRDKMRRCIAHPTTRRPVIERCEALDYSARASALLTYAKLRDDINDSRPLRAFACRLALPFYSAARRRAGADALYKTIEGLLCELSEIENKREASVDAPSDVFGRLLGTVFAYEVRPIERDTAESIGYHLGRFIYAADAAEDYAADLKSGSYNPFVCMSDGKALTPEEKEGIRCAAMLELKYLADAVSELDFTGYATIEGIVKNILYLGLPKRIEFLGDTGKDADKPGKDT